MITTLRKLFSRRWRWVTLLVLAGVAVLISLGNWQLDRREQRRAANALLAEQLAAEPLNLNDPALDVNSLPEMPDRAATVTGEFDLEEQFWLKLQNFGGQAGGHLIAPLHIAGRGEAVLVDRGWLPFGEADPARWQQYDEPGQVTIHGVIRRSEARDRASVPVEGSREWFRVDVEAIDQRLPYDLVPIYLYQTDDDGQTPPLREQPEADLSEGPHLSYALQWFSFALMLAVGYFFFVHRAETRS
ncbi:MAG: SURF1 family protein [Anaerolineae bacterium]|nr:SURF1 family protein [Anaerolineae bacterium]